jgi:amidase
MTPAPAGAPDHVFAVRLQVGGDGPRIAIKDSIDIAGFPTRMGCACFAGSPPAARHARVVAALIDRGCRIIGKTTMHELAYGVTGVNHWSGTPLNPRAPDRVPGGSSGGSAVSVALGLVDFAVGTDTGGSIRIPATCCGVYGLKPTFGRLSREGVHPARSSLDCVGPFAGSLSMLELAMELLDDAFRTEPTPPNAAIGWVNAAAAPDIAAAAQRTLSGAGLTVHPAPLPSFERAFDAGLCILGAENWAAFGHLASNPLLGADVRARLLQARGITREQVAAAETVRRAFSSEVDEALDRFGTLALPTLPELPLLLQEAAEARRALASSSLVRPFNLSGHPALTIPLALPGGLPAGLQLVGRKGADAALCAVARCVTRSA